MQRFNIISSLAYGINGFFEISIMLVFHLLMLGLQGTQDILNHLQRTGMTVKLFLHILVSLLKIAMSFVESGVATLLIDKLLFLC